MPFHAKISLLMTHLLHSTDDILDYFYLHCRPCSHKLMKLVNLAGFSLAKYLLIRMYEVVVCIGTASATFVVDNICSLNNFLFPLIPLFRSYQYGKIQFQSIYLFCSIQMII